MSFYEVLRQTVATLRAHKLRSFLTMFGIVWGIASVILMVGLGKGFSRDQKERMKSLGTDLVIVWGGRTSAQAGGYAAGREIELQVRDARLIHEECHRVKNVSPELRRAVFQVSEFNSANRPVRGVWPEFQNFRSLRAAEGRLMNVADEQQARRVVLLGVEARKQLFPGRPALGATLQMNGFPYTVIGVLEKKNQNSSYGSGPDNTQLFVPYSAMARDFPPRAPGTFPGWINNLVFEVQNPEEHEEAEMQVRRLLGRLHYFDANDKDALMIWNTMQGSKMVQRIFDVMTLFFGCIAVTTLCLGGIGVMNIMLVSVTERTREIGVRKALGATRQDIARQFFAESAVITLVSGMGGLAAGLGICLAMEAMPRPEFIPAPVISAWAVVVSCLTLTVITFAAGMYPAQRAADLTPVEALRFE